MRPGEFEDWIKYNRVEPFGFEREEQRFAILAANIIAGSANNFRDKRTSSPAFWLYKHTTAMTPDESLNHMKAMFPMAKKRKRVSANGN
ncbi:hypothetical protein [uncultured Paraglaciecola sp.]|uniref:phage tail assembly protein T n=1 Tax=uncultured Paraglaciecola sp. TaxID=1765024 RepID=UPI0026297132|nr:hypothetical protein [uncultured Paraglaciecola sp.]